MHITASYETTPQERVRMLQQGMAKQRRNAWTLGISLLLGGPVWGWALHEPVAGVVAAVFALGLLTQLTVGTRSAARQQTAAVPGATEVTVTPTGVALRRPGHATEIAWWSVRFVESADFLLLFHAPRFFTAVPKRCFTLEQLAEVRAAAAAGRTVQPDARPVG
ncbi:YcxB family protein [Kitasatospora arboriphila]|uniref:YcxB-like C-terminal domain-containing protein n=1 Tax=Kitasatospora arboriphila TaxID=258052 RepID=A0ABN1TGT4_9ACTN